jgi:CHASE2 domain-containing sensor protein
MLRFARILTILRPFTRKGWGHWLRFLLLLAAASWLGHLLSSANWLTPLRYNLYHRQLLMRDRSQIHPTRTALVLLSDEDYWGDGFAARTPLKRDVLAGLVDRLNAVGANTVALDVDLRSPRPHDPGFEYADYKAEDEKLLAAIGRMCAAGRHVVLASSVRFGDDGYEETPSIYTSRLKQKELGCVTTGYIQLPFDMRRMPGPLELANGDKLDSLSLAVTKIAAPDAYAVATDHPEHGFRFSEYLSQEDFFRPLNGRRFVFSLQQLTTTPDWALRDQLDGKLVFVGANWHTYAYETGPLADSHNSPGGTEPGVMLHANFVEAMLNQTGTFTPISDSTAEMLEIALALVLAAIGALEIHSAWKWAALATSIVLSILFTYTLLQNLGLFLDFLVPLLMILLHSLGDEAIEIWHEFREMKRNEANTVRIETAEGEE